jgi:basic membrane protein A
MCTSAFAAASENGGKVIGGDVDQAADSPTVITSAMKGLREGTAYALEKFYAGKWEEIADKSANLGVNDNAVGLPTEEASWGFKNFTVEEYNALFEKLQKGEIVVDANVEGAETKEYSNVVVDFIQ